MNFRAELRELSLKFFNQLTYFHFTPVDIANVKNTPRQTLNLIRAKLCALFLDYRDSHNLIEYFSFST